MVLAPRPRVLITDDDHGVRQLLARLLTAAGFDAVEAADAGGAVAALRRGRFDLMVLDMNLPDRSGLEVLASARGEWPGTPVIVVTGEGTIPCAVEAVRGGAYDYLTKPFRGDELVRTAHRAVAGPPAPAPRPDVPSPPRPAPPAVPTARTRSSRSRAGRPVCRSCTNESLAPSRMRWYEVAALLTPYRPYRCPLCYRRSWQAPKAGAAAGSAGRVGRREPHPPVA